MTRMYRYLSRAGPLRWGWRGWTFFVIFILILIGGLAWLFFLSEEAARHQSIGMSPATTRHLFVMCPESFWHIIRGPPV